MNRVFGRKKAPGPPPPSLGEASQGVNFYKEVRSSLNDAKYEELMTVDSDDSNVVFLANQDGDTIKELIEKCSFQ